MGPRYPPSLPTFSAPTKPHLPPLSMLHISILGKTIPCIGAGHSPRHIHTIQGDIWRVISRLILCMEG